MMQAIKYCLFLFGYVICLQLYSQEMVKTAYPIDIVYLWVDGKDPEWQFIKDMYLVLLASEKAVSFCESRALCSQKVSHSLDGVTNNRFMENEELRYSLRSVFKYAPFFNHIYIVTMNQKPHWLASHPQVTIIDHKELFKNAESLPTFNSHALESNLHRIPQLSEHFIYFNDDVFLGGPVTPGDFFVGDGLHVLFEKSLSPSGPPQEGETAYRRAWRNTNAFLDAHYTSEPRYRLCHAPFALRKSYMQQFEDEFPHIFASNSSHRFRCDEDFNVTNGLLQYYWLYHNKVVLQTLTSQPLSNMMVEIRSDKFLKKTQDKIALFKKMRPVTFCLQDTMDEHSHKTRQILHDLLEEYYPDAAPWEQ